MDEPKEDKKIQQQVKEKQDEQSGISEQVDAEGQTVVTVDAFEKDTFDFKYNGEYTIARITVRHQDLWAGLANQSKNTVGLENSITDGAQEIVRNREGQNIQVKHVMAMIKNEGVDPDGNFTELTDEEKMMLNVKAAKGVDMMQVYSNMTTMLHRLIVKSPDNLTLKTEDDWIDFQPALGKELFDRCMSLLMTKFTMPKGLKKK